jgi:RNA polymerase sigma-70 factor (ECF subfamily)
LETKNSFDDFDMQSAAGRKTAFEFVYKRHFVFIFHIAKRFVTDSQLAEDITTEVFLKLWERFDNFTNLQSIQSFLYTSAKNACINQYRSDKRAKDRLQEIVYLSATDKDDPPRPEEVSGQVYQYIFDEIEKLPAQLKKVFKMAYVDGKSNEAIALELGINNQSVRNHKARALKAIRIALLDKDLFAYLFFLFWLERL